MLLTTQEDPKMTAKTVSLVLAECHINPELANFTFTVTMKRQDNGELCATHRMVAYMYRNDGKTTSVQAKCQTTVTLEDVANRYMPARLIESLLGKQINKQKRKEKK